ncbi:uncharacterized protein [Triticum aestivum]|uniref:uncharacterized protein n=1 Tax=Triticum aestivum TaxID=4565 RepID=UPI001D01453F|nr:uncharacterized protein LOC123187350 [Triticum aestivum]
MPSKRTLSLFILRSLGRSRTAVNDNNIRARITPVPPSSDPISPERDGWTRRSRRSRGPGRRPGGRGNAAGQGGPVAAPVIYWFCEHCGDLRHDNQARHLVNHIYMEHQETQQRLRQLQAREAYQRAHGGSKKRGNRRRH